MQLLVCVPPKTGARTLVRFHACCNACPRVGAFLIPPTVCHILPPTSPIVLLQLLHSPVALTKNKSIASIIYHSIGTRLSINTTRHINLLLFNSRGNQRRRDGILLCVIQYALLVLFCGSVAPTKGAGRSKTFGPFFCYTPYYL